jgi:magnesium-transporting ATPase (P-type)
VSTRSSLRLPGEPWLIEATEVAAALGTDLARGLTSEEAAARLAVHGPNQLDAPPPVPGWRRLLRQLRDPLVYLLLGAMLVSLVAWVVEGAEGVPFEVLVIGVIVAFNAVLGWVQESRAEQAVAALQRMAAATARVLRDGREVRVPATDLVPGDVILLAEGDAVPADARMLEAASLMVAEASLTGESQPVPKEVAPLAGRVALADRSNMVFDGTSVVRGRGKAVVTATGMASETGRVAGLLGETEEARTPLQREVETIGKTLGIAVLVIAVVVVGAILAGNDISGPSDLVDVMLVGVSLAVAAVPEGLPAILSVVLALGVQRMARHNAIVKRLSSVETLGSASVVCSDKTGTLTKSEMMIVSVATASGEVEITGSGYLPEGELRVDGHAVEDPDLLEEVTLVLRGGSLANDAVLRYEDGGWVVQGDPTEAAFLVAERKLGLAESRTSRFERVGEIPFTSERKLMTAIAADAEREGLIDIVTKGAPDVVLERCSHERVGREERPLTPERREELMAIVESLADRALRTIAVAYRLLPDRDQPPEEEAERDLVYVGVVGIIDPPRPEAKTAIAEAQSAGIRVMMITGDHPRTAARIAADLGIGGPDVPVLSGPEMDDLDEAGMRQAVATVSVYARVAPEHKLRIVEALRAEGHVVAMTGDGVNDAPALKAADIGVAMGLTGTDVAKEAADMVLADDNFATIIAAVREGRGIFTNIRRFLRFLLSSNIGEVLTMFLGVVLAGLIGLEAVDDALAVPLLATQILWINLLTDSGPALALGVDPPPAGIMERPPRRLTDRVIDRRMWSGILIVGSLMSVVTLFALDLRLEGGLIPGSGELVEARTMAFTTLVIAQLFNCLCARSDRQSAFVGLLTNPLLWAAIALSVLLQVAVVHTPFLNPPFGTTPLSVTDWLICTGLASLVLWGDELRKLAMRGMAG